MPTTSSAKSKILIQISHLRVVQSSLNPPDEERGRLDNPAEILLDALGFESTSLDALVASTGLSSTSVASLLLVLEQGGRVASDSAGRYYRVPNLIE